MRFNDPAYLERWKSGGKYPAIHDNIFNLIEATLENESVHGENVLDLCCSTGLLGTRILQIPRVNQVVGVDADFRALARADLFDIPIPLYKIRLSLETLSKFLSIVNGYNIDSLVMRRCAPELFADKPAFATAFVQGIYDYGVQRIFLEGRVATRFATNPLATLEKEVGLFSEHYEHVVTSQNCAYLRVK